MQWCRFHCFPLAREQARLASVNGSDPLVAGFSIWQVASMDEAVAWVKRSPLRDSVVELRKVLDAQDFDDSFAAEIAAADERQRAEPTATSS